MAGEKTAYSFSMATINPEDYHKLVLFTNPENTPILSAIGAGRPVTNTKHEWPLGELGDAIDNAVVEGADITAGEEEVPARLYNVVQQMDRPYGITDIQEKINKLNGVNMGLGEQMRRASIRLKKDMNKAIIENSTRTEGVSGTASRLGGLPYWLNTSNYPSANIVAAGSTKLSETKHFLKGLQAAYDDHDPDGKYWVFCNSNKKLSIDQFTGMAVNNRQTQKSAQLNVDVEFYHSSFGDVVIMMDRQMTDTDLYILDPEYIKKSFLIPIETNTIQDKSNFKSHKLQQVVTTAFTIEMRDPKCHARISGLAAG